MEHTNLYTKQLPSFLPDLLKQQYGTEYTEKIISGYAAGRKTTLRVNTLKSSLSEIAEFLQKENIAYRAVSWYEDALVIENADEARLRQLSAYEDGKFYLQSLSSMLPPIILAPNAGADILDMAAAPGSKTTQMAAMTGNKAHITACEINPIRAEKLRYNMEKQGASCVYILQKDASKLDSFLSFDRILLDAPCSGSGTLDLSNPKLGSIFTRKLIDNSVKTQRTLLLKAIDLLKKGQQMVYSTCSVLSCENEDVVSYALSKRKCRIVPIDTAAFARLPLLPVKLEGTVCIAPDETFEGFFIAKLQKE